MLRTLNRRRKVLVQSRTEKVENAYTAVIRNGVWSYLVNFGDAVWRLVVHENFRDIDLAVTIDSYSDPSLAPVGVK
jgi:hypothetical protein